MNNVVSTHSLPPKERLQHWSEHTVPILGKMSYDAPDTTSFHGQLYYGSLAQLNLNKIRTSNIYVRRTPEAIQETTSASYKAIFYLSGQVLHRQNDKELCVKAGDWILTDNSQPYESYYQGDCSILCVTFPTHMLTNDEDLSAYWVNRKMVHSYGMGLVTFNFAQTIFSQLNSVSKNNDDLLTNTLIDLILANIKQNETNQLSGLTPLKNSEAQTLIIKKFIEDNLDNPQLSVDLISANLYISKRHIHHLFQQEGLTASRYFWNLRHEKCKQDLENWNEGLTTISEIAFRWGFKSSQHFAQSFKKRFGLSPRAYRKRAYSKHQSSTA